MYNRIKVSSNNRAKLNETPFRLAVPQSSTKQVDYDTSKFDYTMPKPSKTSRHSIEETEDTINKKRKTKGSSSFSTIELFDQFKRKHRFPLFRDVDLGIEKGKQILVHSSNNDDDYFTDDEQLEETMKYCAEEVKEGIKKEFPNSAENYEGNTDTDQDDDEDKNSDWSGSMPRQKSAGKSSHEDITPSPFSSQD